MVTALKKANDYPFGAYLGELRAARDLSQKEVASRLNLAVTYYNKVERGAVPPPSVLTAVADRLHRLVDRRTVERDLLRQRLAEVTEAVNDAEKRLDDLEAERAFFEVVTEAAQETARLQTENMVTYVLQSVLGSSYAFRVELGTMRSRPDATFKVVTPTPPASLETDPVEGKGGGVADVLALALRILLLEAARPAIGSPLLLDEPAKNLSEDYDPQLAKFLASVCADCGRQIFMVTHKPGLAQAAEKVYYVAQQDGVSQVTEQPA